MGMNLVNENKKHNKKLIKEKPVRLLTDLEVRTVKRQARFEISTRNAK